ncbi:MAG: glycosyltransferase family 4 protein [Hyphomonadaceae bacterium]
MLLARQLDVMTTGNDAYLMVFLRAVKRAGLDVRLIFAPRRSFMNRPWLHLHQAYADIASEIVWPQTVRVGNWFWSLSPYIWGRFAVRLFRETLRRLKINPAGLARISSPLGHPLTRAEERQLANESNRRPAVVAVAEYSSLAPVLERIAPGVHKAALLHDLFSLRAASFRDGGTRPDHADTTIETEARWVRAAETLFYASRNEMAAFAPQAPNAVGVWLRPEVPGQKPEPAPGPARAVFIGTKHGGNTDAMHHLVRDIWPLVRKQSPEAELWIAGSTCSDLTPEDLAQPGVKALGRVPSLAVLGGPGSLGLAPTRVASGVSIKVAEYLQLGMPTVVYPTALEGFGDALSDLVEIAPDTQALADTVVALLNDPERRSALSERGVRETPGRLSNDEVVARLSGLTPGCKSN